jgi:hypothetical protein
VHPGKIRRHFQAQASVNRHKLCFMVIIVHARFHEPSRHLLIGGILSLFAGIANAATITLGWNPNSEPNITAYRVHYGTAAAPFSVTLESTTTSAIISSLKLGLTYTFAVTALNSDRVESDYSVPVSYTVGTSEVIPPAVLANISSRTQIGTGEDVLIGGFIINGIVGKKVALRGIGPSLAAFGVTGTISDPIIQVLDASGAVIASNDNWNVPGEELTANGLAPSDAREAGLVVTLQPGSYTAIVSGKDSTTGIGLFELFDLDAAAGRVGNISTRSRVETEDGVMIGGFILNAPGSTKVIVRAIGPSLVQLGVKDALLDPTLELYDSSGTLISSNDNWRDDEASILETTLAPTDDREAAIVATLLPGAYSGVIRGVTETTGVALIEVFALNQ